MVRMKNNTNKTIHWTFSIDYCEVIGEHRTEGRIWEYVAITHGLKRCMKSDKMLGIYGMFEVHGRQVRYSCYIGSDADIKRWGIVQESGDGEMWDDIRFLIDGHAVPIY